MTSRKLHMLILAMMVTSCEQPLNSPYPASRSGAEIYYTSFAERPKHLDPAKSYSSGEYRFLSQIYEPPFDYHFLKRPYELVPLSATQVPEPTSFDAAGNVLLGDPLTSDVHRVVYRITIRRDSHYQPHPCFAKASDGSPYYADLQPTDVVHVDDLRDLKRSGTRPLLAKDFVTQIGRLCDPRLACPIYSTMKQYILGMEEYRQALTQRLEAARTQRRANAGLAYDPVRDEQRDPIVIDYLSIPFAGARIEDDHTFSITLKRKYPQMLYWLAMPFFAPMPQEAIDFYGQGPLLARNITLDRYPVGTGPYRFETYAPNLELVLVRNEHFHDATYPTEGEPGDREAGLLDSAGQRVPFLDKLVFKLEKESLPRWNKFLQGYYDRSGISEDSFDQAVQFGQDGGPGLSDEMREAGITLATSIRATIFYFAFNMLDPVVGGYAESKQKLRQALSIAMNNEQWIQIFNNGRGITAHGPIPPGIFGGIDGVKTFNPFIYKAEEGGRYPVRKTIDEARQLLVDAGFPNGLDPSGKPLTIRFDTYWDSAAAQTRLLWIQKQVETLGVRLEVSATDYSTFRDKTRNANYQMLFWGWNADYPDPENFLFLLYGPNGKKVSGGENVANYDNPRVNHLFEQMENMTSSPQRMGIINRMTSLIQQDAPWIFMMYPVDYTLSHSWVRNLKPNLMTYNTMKFLRIDATERVATRREWNRPVYWPLLLIMVVLVAITLPAVRVVRKNR